MRRVAAVLWLTLVWVALWGDLTIANVVGGLLAATLVLVLVPLPGRGGPRHVSPAPALRYTLLFLRDLVVATAEVARQVFWPIDRLRPAVLEVPMHSRDPGLLSLVANTITLTPGTLTLEVDGARSTLWVHVLHLPEGNEEKVVSQAQALERLGARVLRVPLSAARSPGSPAAPRPPSRARSRGRSPGRRR